MRICILNEFFYPDDGGGTGTVISELARELFDRHSDLHIDVVTSQHLYRENTALQSAFEDWDGIKIYRLKTPRPNGKSLPVRTLINTLFSVAALWRLLFRKYDLLLVTTAPPVAPFVAVILKKLKKIPYVYTVYDLEPDRAKVMKVVSLTNPFAKVFGAFQRLWLHEANKVVVLGRCMKDHICSVYDLPVDKVDVIPVGADPVAIQPKGRMTEFRQKNEIEGFVVLYSGNFGRYHDFNTILDAAKRLKGRNDRIKFVLVGAGAQKEHIVARVESEKIDNVQIFPFVSHESYPDLLATADVSLVTLEPGMDGICVPSKFYSILASGRPTIAMVGDTCEVARVIREADCGVQVVQGDTDKLVETLDELAHQDSRLIRMGDNARTVLSAKYSSPITANHYYNTFLSAIGCKPTVEELKETAVSHNNSKVVGDNIDNSNSNENKLVSEKV